MIKTSDIPPNFEHLYEGEEDIRQKSLAAISESEDLKNFLALIERCMNLLDGFVRLQKEDTDDGRAIQHLAIRLFNGFAASWKLLASGYYQKAALIQRDQVETANLVAYFYHHQDKIQEWRLADRKKQIREFSPHVIRSALDARVPGKSRREEIYQKFSVLAGHPSKVGFQMLRPAGENAVIGPFFDLRALQGLLEESVQLAAQCGNSCLLFVDTSQPHLASNAYDYLVLFKAWSDRTFGKRDTDSGMDLILELKRIAGRA